eukprot:3690901-Pyramimonas_sp.AAC.1
MVVILMVTLVEYSVSSYHHPSPPPLLHRHPPLPPPIPPPHPSPHGGLWPPQNSASFKVRDPAKRDELALLPGRLLVGLCL